MKTFFIFSHPVLGLEAVPTGFSWRALLFGFAWAFYHRLWLSGTVAFALFLATLASLRDAQAIGGFPFRAVVPTVFAVLLGSACVSFGVYGNLWRYDRLFDQGYAIVATVEARNATEAVAIFTQL